MRPAGLQIPSIECHFPLSLPGGLVGVDIGLVRLSKSLWKLRTTTLYLKKVISEHISRIGPELFGLPSTHSDKR